MKDAAAAGLTRIELAAAAAVRAGDLLPDQSSVGLWIFATKLQGAAGWRSLEPAIPLNAPERNGTHKQALQAALRSLPGRLSPGGTALYDTALAAVRDARRQYDPSCCSPTARTTSRAGSAWPPWSPS
jgi:Ca-activated chloride channel family protein